jgi:hypothetical protein
MVPRTSPLMDEVRIESRRQDIRACFEAPIPRQVPSGVVENINTESDLTKLMKWVTLAGTAKTLEQFQAEM